ncbi:MAG TPA: LLM class flavin-dependent oxidoreductase [Novosphingobium sp.]
MVKLSVLDLVRVRDNGTPRSALHESRAMAVHAEALGFERYWVAEHHNLPGIAAAATSVILGYLAEGTSRIRLGSGGVMLPNHAPLIIAEQFGTLAQLYPGRIDLGLGRAPGTDQRTVRAIRRTLDNADNFPRDVLELQGYFAREREPGAVEAVVASGTEVPLWILGSSTYGAQLAAYLGLPYGFASHFAPALLLDALAVYRAHFQPSAQCAAPYAMVGVNIIAAPTDAEARHLATTQQMSIANLFRGTREPSRAPIADIDSYWTPAEKAQAQQFLARSIIGSPATVRAGIAALVAETGADELMIVSDVYDQAARARALALIAEAATTV